MKLRYTLLLLLSALLGCLLPGCGDKQTVATPEKPVATRPPWLDARPVNSAYYIGIGNCSKTAQPLDYQNIAKKNALNDMATEISVRVQGSTFLNSLEVNRNFSEEFISTINTTTNEQIEDYEIAGTWETEKEFWVYYRLNKAQYQAKKAEKKNQVLRSAYDFYLKGLDAENTNNLSAAIDLYLRGLVAMKNYWAEVNEFQSEQGNIYLDNELYAAMRRCITGISLQTNLEKITLSSANNYREKVTITALYNGKPVKGVEIVYNYKKEKYMKPRTVLSDDKGNVLAEVDNVSTFEKNNTLDVLIGIEALIPKDLDQRITEGLLKGLRTDSRKIPIELLSPTISVASLEKTLGEETGGATLLSAMKAELSKRGMRIVTGATEANYTINIQSNTTAGGTTQGFILAFLEMNVTVKNVKTGEIIFQDATSSMKGVQLTIEGASIDAYKKGMEKIENQLAAAIVDAIL
jgi:hypothetical protein